ncbi:response regulator [Winogradskyella sp. DF17]|uniref:Response regulator n=1 Tax=Winogradskyella pelagia TaxID=2819984 RepID=A0ABS3T5F7_9FLAO|nr:response regulator [Winogradskyella sp. DF17]MBO3116965.1 response regulator [Winogradskyella sp. DF17]
MEVTFVIIDDNKEIEEHPLLFTLEDKFKNVKFFSNPQEGLNFIKSNLEINLIVLLDIEFSKDDILDGHDLLKEIYSSSSLVPVILWSGINQANEEFSDFINNRAFGFLSKDCSIAEAMEIVDKAYLFLEKSIENSIEDWIIESPEDKDKPIYFSTEGDAYSLNDILSEVRNQTEIGKDFAQRLNALTIDLLLRGKEKL